MRSGAARTRIGHPYGVWCSRLKFNLLCHEASPSVKHFKANKELSVMDVLRGRPARGRCAVHGVIQEDGKFTQEPAVGVGA